MAVIGETQLGDLSRRVLGDERLRRSFRDDLSPIHDDQAVAQLLGLVHVMGGQHEGHALLLEPEQPLPHQMPGLRVEARGGFVQQQQPR